MTLPPFFNERNFRFYWASLAIAQTGSFFTAVALPWLGMALSHDDPVVVTTLLATVSLPNSVFIVFGGGLADRFSSYRTLLFTRTAFVLVMASLAALTVSQRIPLALLYGYAAVLGTLGAIGIPASQSLLPSIVKTQDLGIANGVVMATIHTTQMVAPIAAGGLIYLMRHFRGVAEGRADPFGIGLAFGVDALAAAGATALLAGMLLRPARQTTGPLFALIAEGVRFSWNEKSIRLVLGYLVVISFFVQGPLLAALPLFTRFQLGLYEGAYGSLYAMVGIGTVSGAGLAMAVKPTAKYLGRVVLGCDLAVGLSLFALGQTRDVYLAGALLLLIGGGLGVTMVAGTTWFQTRTPEQYMGRVMSLVMFAVVGLVPLSAALTGYIISRASVVFVLAAAGAATTAGSIVGLLTPAIRRMGDGAKSSRPGMMDSSRCEKVPAPAASSLL